MQASTRLILDYAYRNEAELADRLYLTQPVGGGQVVEYSWRQFMDQARRMAAHLRWLQLEPGARIGLLSKNCAHFFMAELAIWMAGYSTVAIFPTEGRETVSYILDHSDARLLFLGRLDQWSPQWAGLAASLPCIALPDAAAGTSWDEIVAHHEPLAGCPQRAAGDLAVLIYTSGSTGQPKGVMQSFGALTRAAEGLVRAGGGSSADRFVSYLPLSHVTERACTECGSIVLGCQVYFCESLDTFVEDIKRARPTVFISVPRLWLKFQLGVFSRITPGRLDFMLRLPLLGKALGSKLLAAMGLDQVRFAVSCSAPVPAELIAWYRRLGLNLLEGYGMTEDCGYSHLSTMRDSAPGFVGVPLPGVEVKLSEEQEVLVKSPGQLMGYFKRPDLDAECLTVDGYFRTGDKGERTAEGLLKITGRIKELFKTAKGKYVAPAPIENRINMFPLIELSMVSGAGRPAAFAMVVLAPEVRAGLAEAPLRRAVESQLAQLLHEVNRALPTYEQLRMLVVAKEPWSIENGCLTPTLKIKRSRIEALAAPSLELWYRQDAAVLWQ